MEEQEPLPLKGIGEVGVYVADLDRAAAWYQQVLDLEIVGEGESFRFLRVGDDADLRTRLILFDPGQTSDQQSPPAHGVDGPTHFALGCSVEVLDQFRERLKAHDVEIEDEIEWGNGDCSIYFRDPDGNSLEIYGQSTFSSYPSW